MHKAIEETPVPSYRSGNHPCDRVCYSISDDTLVVLLSMVAEKVLETERKRQAAKEKARDPQELLTCINKLIEAFDSEIHNEYDGTSMLEDRLAEINFARDLLPKPGDKN